MNRLPSTPSPSLPLPEAPSADALARALRDPSLLRLAQSIEELHPELARALCRSGLAALTDPAEREAWQARLGPWLEEAPESGNPEDEGDDGGLMVAA